MTALVHLTSNTGHVMTADRTPAVDALIADLAPLLAAEEGEIPWLPGWWLDIWVLQDPPGTRVAGTAAFQIAPGPARATAGQYPYVFGVVCWDDAAAADAWEMAHGFARQFGPDQLPARPPVPWLAVTFTPWLLTLSPERVAALGGLEQAVAWALMDDAEDHDD